MSKIRLVVSDLDGTLLSPDHLLTESVKEAVQRFVRSGGLFTIATGRFGLTAKSVVEELDIDIPYILCNGAVIADRHRVREAVLLELAELAPLLEEADRRDVTVMLFDEDGVSALRRTPDVERFEYKEKIGCRIIDPASGHWKNGSVQKVLLIGDMKKIRSIWNSHSAGFRQTYSTIQSEDDYFEIIPANQSKGEALKKLARMLNVDRSEVMAIGNQLNDLDMIRNAGIGVAVANSHDDLKKYATYVCARSYGDGVVEAMDKFCFRQEDKPI